MKKIYKFYDTCSLLIKADSLFEDEDHVIISSITLDELENIKTSANKDADVKYAARRLLHLLDEHPDAYEVWIFKKSMLEPIIEKDLSITNDTSILATAIDYDKNCHPDETIFVTNDLALKNIANLFFGNDSIESVEEEAIDDYTGYLEITMSDDLMSEFYSQPFTNMFNLKVNQYLVVSNMDNEIVDTLCWTGEEYRHLNYKNFSSRYFGDVKPFKGDIY
jgi:predicted ribonuclease YlaK